VEFIGWPPGQTVHDGSGISGLGGTVKLYSRRLVAIKKINGRQIA